MTRTTGETLPRFLNGNTLMLHWDAKCGGVSRTWNISVISPEKATELMTASHIRQCRKCRPIQ